jgi:chromosomal replication initiation ATPase DnaA
MERLITRSNFYVNYSVEKKLTGNQEQKIAKILKKISEISGLTIEDLKGKSRKRELVEFRQIAAYICYHNKFGSLTYIGLHLGGRGHATVIHSRDAAQGLIDSNDAQFLMKWNLCKDLILK